MTAPRARAEATLDGVTPSHPDRALWPGITKADLAAYWLAVAETALPGVAARPLAVVRCPEGIAGPRFFQKHAQPGQPGPVRAGVALGHPYLAIDGVAGLVALTQMAAIELHAWGAPEAEPAHPDRLVFDLDPGEGVPFATVVTAAQTLRRRLDRLGLVAFCRTTGGRGLHLVVPLRPRADWGPVHDFCRGFSSLLAHDAPDRFVATVARSARKGRILIDWLRNGPGATAVASFSPRARSGATVATPLAWREVTARLDPAAHTLRTVPDRLRRQRQDPWAGFTAAAAELAQLDSPAASAGEE